MENRPRQYRPESEKPKSTDPPKQENRERQSLPNVWDYLERDVRLHAPDVADRPRWGTQDYKRVTDEMNRLYRELREKGTPRDQLILDLCTEITMEPAPLPVPADFRDLSLEEFQQFRSRIEPMSEEEISEEIYKAKEEYERKDKAIRDSRHRNPDDPYSLARP